MYKALCLFVGSAKVVVLLLVTSWWYVNVIAACGYKSYPFITYLCVCVGVCAVSQYSGLHLSMYYEVALAGVGRNTGRRTHRSFVCMQSRIVQ